MKIWLTSVTLWHGIYALRLRRLLYRLFVALATKLIGIWFFWISPKYIMFSSVCITICQGSSYLGLEVGHRIYFALSIFHFMCLSSCLLLAFQTCKIRGFVLGSTYLISEEMMIPSKNQSQSAFYLCFSFS